MRILKRGLFILVLPLMAFTTIHKFYVSVTNIGYSETDNALQITSRVFIDDFERVLEERYDFKTELGLETEMPKADSYVERYLRSKFLVRINEKDAHFTFIGKKRDNDVLIFYLEIPNLNYNQIKTLEIQNEVLTDLFEEQQNVIHFKLKDLKKSFILMRENTTGKLNL